MVSNHLSSCKSHQFKNIAKDYYSQFLVTPNGQTTEAIVTCPPFCSIRYLN